MVLADTTAPRSPAASAMTSLRITPLTAVIMAILAGTAALRIAGASGSLWLDEIWSLQNVEALPNAAGVFLDISEDNNHFLNSLWMWVVGPAASPLALRAAAVAFGIGTVALAIRIALREGGRIAAVFAGVVFATSYVLIHYGSEARGYAGMLFGLLWAYDAMLRFLDAPVDDRPRLEFGLAIAIGSLSQIIMLPAAALLAAGAVVCIFARTRRMHDALGAALKLGSVSILGAAPVCAAVAAGLLHTHILRLGDQHPFAWSAWTGGIAGVIGGAFGIPEAVPPVVILIAALALALCVMPLLRLEQRCLSLALIVGLPSFEALARLPNLHFARFHLAIAAALLLVFAQALAALWSRGGPVRIGVLATFALFLAGNTLNIVPFLTLGRGDYLPAVRLMGNATYATIDVPGVVTRLTRYYGAREGVKLVHTPMATCADPHPDWFILADGNDGPATPAQTFDVGPTGCRTAYTFAATYRYYGLSGFRWTLYKRPAAG